MPRKKYSNWHEITMTETSAPHLKQPLLKTPFHERARALAQVDRFIPWAGYTTVDVFTTMEQEYFAIRNAATLYDLTPMVKYGVPARARGGHHNPGGPGTSPNSSRTASRAACGATTPGISSTTARFFAWEPTNIESARRSGKS